MLSMSRDIKIILKFDRSAEAELALRVKRQMPTGAPLGLGDVGTSVHFLRGVASRATFVLSSFYLLLASDQDGNNACTIPGPD